MCGVANSFKTLFKFFAFYSNFLLTGLHELYHLFKPNLIRFFFNAQQIRHLLFNLLFLKHHECFNLAMSLICFFGNVCWAVIDIVFNQLFEYHNEMLDEDDDYEKLIDVVVHQFASDAIYDGH
jgi:hypothetical protein